MTRQLNSLPKALLYINRWHEDDENFWENFPIIFKDDDRKEIDLSLTLLQMPNDLVLKVAIDLWIETPDFIPSIPTFKNDLKENYNSALNSFEDAFKQIEEKPDMAIWLACTTLESIIKHIFEDDSINKPKNFEKQSLYKLAQDLLKEFEIFPNKELPDEIKSIWNSLLNISKNIDDLRSWKTHFHWKTSKQYLIKDPIYAYFIINSTSTIWLFLMSFYKLKYEPIKKEQEMQEEDVEIYDNDIKPEDLPF